MSLVQIPEAQCASWHALSLDSGFGSLSAGEWRAGWGWESSLTYQQSWGFPALKLKS